MPTENPNHPQPDDIPDNERTGGEPNPSGKSRDPKHKETPQPTRRTEAS